MKTIMRSKALCASTTAIAMALLSAGAAHAQTGPSATEQARLTEDIVVTARLRSESLLDVPVAVTALTSADLARYGAANLNAIGSQTPGMIINKASNGGGGQITLRGISTASGQAGFEQSVSINVDGVQTSRGRAAISSFFDLQQVEVLKGPQALFFGKNSPAGVISLVSRGPTEAFEGYVQAGYEFAGRELIGEGAVSGPISEDLGFRIAVRGRHMGGWMINNAVAEPVPFDTPGTTKRRPGEREIAGRLTLAFTPSSPFSATLKLFGSSYRDDGPSNMSIQPVNCGTSAGPEVTIGGNVFVDPTGDCRLDSNLSNGGISPVVAKNWLLANKKRGQAFGEYDSFTGSLMMNVDLESVLLTSVTGLAVSRSHSFDNYDGTTYAMFTAAEHEKYRSFSQQLRIESNLAGAVNFMAGAYFESSHQNFTNDSRIAPLPADPLTGKYHTWEKPGVTDSKTYSVFAQMLFDITPDLELAAGGRYTHEKKDSTLENTYVHPGVAPLFSSARFVKNFSDNNFSPEVTLTYHPAAETTLYGAYKTGFKSGGLGLSAVLTSATTLDQIDFDSEKVKGFEFGAKGQFGALRAELTVYRYNYRNLQVNSYDPTINAFTIQNAGGLSQFGTELQLHYAVARGFLLRGSAVYNRNRFKDYMTQCYSGQTAADGCTPAGQNMDGRTPARSPDWTGTAGFTYDTPIGSGLSIGLTGDAYVSSAYFSNETLAPGAKQGSYARFDGSVRLQDADGRWELALIGRNLSNKRYMLSTSDKPGTSTGQQYGTVSRPREIMLQARTQF